MNRDMDLIRAILLKIEEHSHGCAPEMLTIDDYSDEQVSYHVHLMGQAGLLRVRDSTCDQSPSPEAVPIDMTWAGHDFLDAARSETIWRKAQQRIGGRLDSISFEVLKALLVSLLKETVGLGTK